MHKKVATYVAVVLTIVLVAGAYIFRTIESGSTNPLRHKTWVATTFTISNGQVQQHPDETVRFMENGVVIRIGLAIYHVPVQRYKVINGLKQGTTPYSTVLVYSPDHSYIRVFVFNDGQNILIIRDAGDQTIQQRFHAQAGNHR